MKQWNRKYCGLVLTLLLAAAPLRAEDEGDTSATKPSGDFNAPVDVSKYKPPIRVACLGDSITFGVGAGNGWGYPDQLNRMLDDKWDVRNFGHSGATVLTTDKHKIKGTKEYTAACDFHPDVVVIMLGTNDSKPDNWSSKAQFPKTYKDLLVSFQKLSSKPRIFVCTPPYVTPKGAFGINQAGVAEMIPMIRQVAGDWGAGVIDVNAATDKHDAWFKDGVHPNVEGATTIAKTVYKALTGTEFTGEVPKPGAVVKERPAVRIVERPGFITYRECFGLIISTGMPADKLEPIRNKFDETAQDVDAKIEDYIKKIDEYGKLRMQYKHDKDPEQQKLYGEYKAKGKKTAVDLENFRRTINLELIRMIPEDFKDEFGILWVNKYVMDRFTPILSTLTSEQKAQIRALCKEDGKLYGHIENTPERSIEQVEIYKVIYDKVLTDEQKKRVEAR